MRVGDGYSAVRHAPVVGLRGQAVECVRAEDKTGERVRCCTHVRRAMASAELAKLFVCLTDLVNFV